MAWDGHVMPSRLPSHEDACCHFIHIRIDACVGWLGHHKSYISESLSLVNYKFAFVYLSSVIGLFSTLTRRSCVALCAIVLTGPLTEHEL